jgi:hypothetical protein
MSNLLDILETEEKEIDSKPYTFTAWPATFALDFLEAQQENLEKGKSDLALMKEIIIKSVSVGGKSFDSKSFDAYFSRKTKHMIRVYEAVLEYNLGDLFTQPDSEE